MKNLNVTKEAKEIIYFLYDSCGGEWSIIESGDEVQETITPDYFDKCESLLSNNDKTFTVGDKSFTAGIDFVTDDDQIVIYIVRNK